MTTLSKLASDAIARRGGNYQGVDAGARAPLLLSTGVVSVPNTNTNADSNVNPSSQQLIPPYRSPYLVREIRFTVSAPATGFSNSYAIQQFLEVELQLGELDITKGHVPICNLCPAVQLSAEISPGGPRYYSSTQTSIYSMFRWVLPKPMYVQPGNGISASYRYPFELENYGLATLFVEMSVVGEMLPAGTPEPDFSCVPYVSAYQNKGVADSSSQAFNLPNPWADKNLYMQRLIGRAGASGGPGFGPESVYGLGTTLSTFASIAITDQDRFPITPAAGIIFGECFDARTKSLEHRRIVPPNGWLQVHIINNNQNSISDYPSYLWISAIGYRKERLT